MDGVTSITEAMRILHISYPTMKGALASGEIKYKKVGRHFFINKESLFAYFYVDETEVTKENKKAETQEQNEGNPYKLYEKFALEHMGNSVYEIESNLRNCTDEIEITKLQIAKLTGKLELLESMQKSLKERQEKRCSG